MRPSAGAPTVGGDAAASAVVLRAVLRCLDSRKELLMNRTTRWMSIAGLVVCLVGCASQETKKQGDNTGFLCDN